jgi:hypothetical protein
VAAAREWVASSGFGEEITVTDAGRLRVYDLDLDAAQFLTMSGEDAFDLPVFVLEAEQRADSPITRSCST